MIKANSSDSLLPIPGAAYIRYSSEMQSDSFSLDAQLRQIKEQAERDNVTIVKVYSDPAQSAYRNETFAPVILPKGTFSTTNELEDKIIGMYTHPGWVCTPKG